MLPLEAGGAINNLRHKYTQKPQYAMFTHIGFAVFFVRSIQSRLLFYAHSTMSIPNVYPLCLRHKMA